MEAGSGAGECSLCLVDVNENQEEIARLHHEQEASTAELKAHRAGAQLCAATGSSTDVNIADTEQQSGLSLNTKELQSGLSLDTEELQSGLSLDTEELQSGLSLDTVDTEGLQGALKLVEQRVLLVPDSVDQLPECLSQSRVVSGMCGEHSSFNGFPESQAPLEKGDDQLSTRNNGEEDNKDQDEFERNPDSNIARPAQPLDADLDDLIGEIWDPHVDSPFPDISYNMANGETSNCELTTEWKSCGTVKVTNGGLHFLQTCGKIAEAEFEQQFQEKVSDFKLFTPDVWRTSGKLLEQDVNEDSALSEEDEDVSELSLPVRPQTLRTNFNLAVSLSCDATPLSPDQEAAGFYYGEEGYGSEDFRNVLEAGRRQSAPDKLPDLIGQSGDDTKLMPKRFGIADFFTRSLFSRKPKEFKSSSHNASGWRLFGKTKENDVSKNSTDSSPQEESSVSSCPPCPTGRRKNLEFEPLSTTALILEDRPANLPAKSVEETQRHKQEYEEMVAGAKRRELKEAQKKKLQMKERHRHEDNISNAMVVWNTEILPHWDSLYIYSLCL